MVSYVAMLWASVRMFWSDGVFVVGGLGVSVLYVYHGLLLSSLGSLILTRIWVRRR